MEKSKQLSHLQMDILRILWERSEATVAEVHDSLKKVRGLAPTTIATVLSRLEKAGVVSHRTQGRQYIFRSLVTEKDVRQSMVSDLIDRLFHGDSFALVGHLLKETDVNPDDLEQVASILEASEEQNAYDLPD